jgi:hypothetical protein
MPGRRQPGLARRPLTRRGKGGALRPARRAPRGRGRRGGNPGWPRVPHPEPCVSRRLDGVHDHIDGCRKLAYEPRLKGGPPHLRVTLIRNRHLRPPASLTPQEIWE